MQRADEKQALEERLAQSERFIQAITDNVQARLAYFDLHGRFQFVNKVLCERFGKTREEMIGRTLAEIGRPGTQSPVEVRFALAMTGLPQRFLYADQIEGETRHILTHLTPHTDEQGRIQGVFGVGIDISAEVAAQDELDRQTATLTAIVEAMPAMVVVWDLNLRCRLVNKAFEKWSSGVREDFVGRTLPEIYGAKSYESSRPWVERALAGETVSFEAESPTASMSRHVMINFIPLHLHDGSVAGFVAVSQDITTQREENLRLELLSLRDPLTGLLNRTGFEEYLIKAVSQGAAEALAVIYIDLDHFKPINDNHGHAAGDEVLREFALRLLCIVRASDAVARLGGDEFAIAVTKLPNVEAAAKIADKVVRAAQQPIQVGELLLTVSASVGVALNAQVAGGWKQLVARADAMAYEAKALGRGCRAVEQAPTTP